MEINQILETIRMVEEENLDIRTITMGISLLDCIDADIDQMCEKIYQKLRQKPRTWCELANKSKQNMVFQSSTSESLLPRLPLLWQPVNRRHKTV